MRDVLTELKNLQISKNQTGRILTEIYKANLEDICNTYFYYRKIEAYCKLEPIINDVHQGYLDYREFFIGKNYATNIPQVFDRPHQFKISEIPIDEIEILSKEEFVAGLKKGLQDALDEM